jgi:hypothetical protein
MSNIDFLRLIWLIEIMFIIKTILYYVILHCMPESQMEVVLPMTLEAITNYIEAWAKQMSEEQLDRVRTSVCEALDNIPSRDRKLIIVAFTQQLQYNYNDIGYSIKESEVAPGRCFWVYYDDVFLFDVSTENWTAFWDQVESEMKLRGNFIYERSVGKR